MPALPDHDTETGEPLPEVPVWERDADADDYPDGHPAADG